MKSQPVDIGLELVTAFVRTLGDTATVIASLPASSGEESGSLLDAVACLDDAVASLEAYIRRRTNSMGGSAT